MKPFRQFQQRAWTAVVWFACLFTPQAALAYDYCWYAFWTGHAVPYPIETYAESTYASVRSFNHDPADYLTSPEDWERPRSGTHPNGCTWSYSLFSLGNYTGIARYDQRLYTTSYYGVEYRGCEGYPPIINGVTRPERVNYRGFIGSQPDSEGFVEVEDVIICSSKVDDQFQVRLTGSSNQIEPGATTQQVRFTARLTNGGHPVQGIVYLTLSPGGSDAGTLSCDSERRQCPFNALPVDATGRYKAVTDHRGEYHFVYQPSPNTQGKVEVKATCDECDKGPQWPIQVGQPDIVIGFFNGVANTTEAAQDSLRKVCTTPVEAVAAT